MGKSQDNLGSNSLDDDGSLSYSPYDDCKEERKHDFTGKLRLSSLRVDHPLSPSHIHINRIINDSSSIHSVIEKKDNTLHGLDESAIINKYINCLKDNEIEACKKLLEEHKDKNLINRFFRINLLFNDKPIEQEVNSLMLVAISESENSEKIEMINYLISEGADIYQQTMKQNTLLNIVCMFASNETLNLVTKLYKEENHFINEVEKTKKLIAVINTPDEERCTPLHYACRRKDIKMAVTLIANGAEVDKPDKHHVYPHTKLNHCEREEIRKARSEYMKKQKDCCVIL
jgi:hypothetical protein